MANPNSPFKRKQYYVLPKFQNHFMRVMLFQAVLIVGGLLYPQYRILSSYIDRVQARQSEVQSTNSDRSHVDVGLGNLTTSDLQDLALLRNSSLIYGSIFIFASCLIFGFYASHRLGGPIYKTILYLKKYRDGHDLEPLKFRKGDFFYELADEVNLSLQTKKKS
jgi:hypothetical protein